MVAERAHHSADPKRLKSSLGAVAAAAFLLAMLPSSVLAAQPSKILLCRSASLKVVGRYLSARLTCDAQAAIRKRAASRRCVETAKTLLKRGFESIRKKSVCPSLPDLSDTIETVYAARFSSSLSGSREAGHCLAANLRNLGDLGTALIARHAAFLVQQDAKRLLATIQSAQNSYSHRAARMLARRDCNDSGSDLLGATRAFVTDVVALALDCGEVPADHFESRSLGAWRATVDHALSIGYSNLTQPQLCPRVALDSEELVFASARLAREDQSDSVTLVVVGLPRIRAELLRLEDDGRTALFGSTGGLLLDSDRVVVALDSAGQPLSNTASSADVPRAAGGCQVSVDLWRCLKRWCDDNALRCGANVSSTALGCLLGGVTYVGAGLCGLGAGLLLDSAIGAGCEVDSSCEVSKGLHTAGCATTGACEQFSGVCQPVPANPNGTDCSRAAYPGVLPQCISPGETLEVGRCDTGYCSRVPKPCENTEICVGRPGSSQCVDCDGEDVRAGGGMSCPRPTITASEATPQPSASPSSTGPASPSPSPTAACGNDTFEPGEQCDASAASEGQPCPPERCTTNCKCMGKVRFVYYDPSVNNPGRSLSPQPPTNIPFDVESFKFQETYDTIRWDVVFSQTNTTAAIDLTATGTENTGCCPWPSFGSSFSTYIEKGTSVKDIEWHVELSGSTSPNTYRALLSLECATFQGGGPNTIRLGSDGSASLAISGNSGPFTADGGVFLPDTPGVEYANVSPYPDCLAAYIRVPQSGDHLELHYAVEVVLEDSATP